MYNVSKLIEVKNVLAHDAEINMHLKSRPFSSQIRTMPTGSHRLRTQAGREPLPSYLGDRITGGFYLFCSSAFSDISTMNLNYFFN
jgi:hypothetical protein